MRILFLHHVSAFGGASKSLIELCAVLKERGLDVTVLCPRGKAADQFRGAGMKTVEIYGIAQWNDTEESHYRGLRWLVLLRELALWPTTLAALWRLRREPAFDCVHANEITILFPGILAKLWLKVPLVVHVRSLQRGGNGGRLTHWLNGLLSRHADLVVAIDERVRLTLPTEMAVEVVHNSLHVNSRRENPGVRTGGFRVALVGSLIAGKGVLEFLEAARICRDRELPVTFVVVGENVRQAAGPKGWVLKKLGFSTDLRKQAEDFVALHSLADRIEFAGFIQNVQAVYQQIDVLCFPSYYDAPGRPVFEAAFFGVPSIVATKHPTSDTLIPNETGLCIPGPDPVALADSIEFFQAKPAEVRRMGENARLLAQRHFDPQRNADAMLLLYGSLVKDLRESAGEQL